ncbi:MAG: hypothetical protein GXN92_02695 [Candidatus Micrarchaeota archaeon]|nr:hypothetical protein [Candidatus Micrarchaeota archaeon]
MIFTEIGEVMPKREIVERKEFGHPDTISDLLAEEASLYLSSHYLKDYGYLLHHNVDKALLVGGEAQVDYGKGEMLKPIRFYLAGRAQKIEEYKEGLIEHLYRALEGILPHMKREWFEIRLEIRRGSEALISTVEQRIPVANDTSFGVGFYPFSEVEERTYKIGRFLYENSLGDQRFGQDIKVMSFDKEVTIAQAFLAPYVESWEEYEALKESLVQEITDRFGVVPTINNADKTGGPYLTLTGTSAEGGDDGQVGRGNRVNGLITPMRMMTLEAAAGKNPWSHVGKTYQVLAQEISQAIYEEKEVVNEVLLVSKIGQPVNQPKAIYVKMEREVEIKEIVEYYLERAPKLYLDIVERKIKVIR